VVAHRLLSRICPSTSADSSDCKFAAYCFRRSYDSSHFARNCPYQGSQFLNTRTSQHCYVHGPTVWGYWGNLNSEGELQDKTLDRDLVLDQTLCDGVCKRQTCEL